MNSIEKIVEFRTIFSLPAWCCCLLFPPLPERHIFPHTRDTFSLDCHLANSVWHTSFNFFSPFLFFRRRTKPVFEKWKKTQKVAPFPFLPLRKSSSSSVAGRLGKKQKKVGKGVPAPQKKNLVEPPPLCLFRRGADTDPIQTIFCHRRLCHFSERGNNIKKTFCFLGSYNSSEAPQNNFIFACVLAALLYYVGTHSFWWYLSNGLLSEAYLAD